MKQGNSITELFGIEYPIIQAGMVWVSGWRLASAVSNEGGLGLIGAGSMKPELLREHIRKCKTATDKPFGVNVPLLRGDADELMQVIIDERVPVVFSSAGSPKKFTGKLKEEGITVVHVVPNVKLGLKVQDAGCDAVVGEGMEAGGHNSPDMVSTLSLIPQLADALDIPVIAAGGIADGRQIAAAIALGAEGVQIGTLFAASVESSASETYKQMVTDADDTGTLLALKKIGLVRMLKNDFALRAFNADESGADKETLLALLGRKRERMGIFEGDVTEGMFEAGQGSGLINEILPVSEIFHRLISQYDNARQALS